MKEITSSQNPLIKQLILLREKSRNRKKEEIFTIEGAREIGLAIRGNYVVETILFQKDIFSEEAVSQLISDLKNSPEIIHISKEVYEKLSCRSSTEGIIAVAQSKQHSLENIVFKNI